MIWSITNTAGQRVGVREASEEQHTIACACGCPKTWTLPPRLDTARQLLNFAETLGFAASMDPHRMLVLIRLCVSVDVDRVLEALQKKPDLMRMVYRRLHQIYSPQPENLLQPIPTIVAVNQTDVAKTLTGLGLIVPASGSVVLSDYALWDEIWSDPSLQGFLKAGDIKLDFGPDKNR